MPDKMPVIVLTPCRFLLAGLESLLRETRLPVRLIQVTRVERVPLLTAITGAAMVIVARESDVPAEKARAQGQIRRLGWLMMSGAMVRVPCLLLAGNMHITVAGSTFWLTREYLACDLEILLGGILANPAVYLSTPSWSPLSEQQKTILEGTLAGLGVEELAEQMHVLPRTVFAHRDHLIKKLGLRNRLELMCLGTQECALTEVV